MFDDWTPSFYCPECGVAEGSYHHDGCDLEICPNCGDQLSVCPCFPGIVSAHNLSEINLRKHPDQRV